MGNRRIIILCYLEKLVFVNYILIFDQRDMLDENGMTENSSKNSRKYKCINNCNLRVYHCA